MKQYKNISDKEIQEYLESTAPLKNYYISQLGDDEKSSIVNVFENGIAYRIMDDNDERAEICIDFLKRHSTPILKTLEEEDNFIKEFNRKHSINPQNLSEIK